MSCSGQHFKIRSSGLALQGRRLNLSDRLWYFGCRSIIRFVIYDGSGLGASIWHAEGLFPEWLNLKS